MNTLHQLGIQIAERRRQLGLKQIEVAKQSGVTAESLSRFERGRLTEFGSRKLIAVLAAVGMEISLVEAKPGLNNKSAQESPR
ncbi:XRE family transcriptional regulator [Xanthomonas sp. WHRI 8391]|uniref:XRE family transcriptional regulator n=1 Tax=Xanthomonas TaxID=338 RepID=UPI001A296923|nr:XRE family transcriptional regulator [Xanthomonas hortorum]MBG3851682.1 helix-turn-helix domain-containing protein [Xanthomonas hortorum pv. carotae]UTS73735.1 helix-turn-helix domain-containing protein [Xanthomonas hortorum]